MSLHSSSSSSLVHISPSLPRPRPRPLLLRPRPRPRPLPLPLAPLTKASLPCPSPASCALSLLHPLSPSFITCVPSPPFSTQHGVQTCQPQSAHRKRTERLWPLQMSHFAVWIVTRVKFWWRVGISSCLGFRFDFGFLRFEVWAAGGGFGVWRVRGLRVEGWMDGWLVWLLSGRDETG